MAIEDGAALGVLFSDLRSKDEIPDRLALFQRLRLDRVSAMQVFSSVGQDEAAQVAARARPHVQGPLPSKFDFHPGISWNFKSLGQVCTRPPLSRTKTVGR